MKNVDIRTYIERAKAAQKIGEAQAMTKRDVGSELLPRGTYPALVAAIHDDQITVKNGPATGEVRDVCRWMFLIQGPDGTMEMELLSSQNFGPRAKAGEWARSILDVESLPRDFDDDMLLGSPIEISLGIKESNGFKNNDLLDIVAVPSGGPEFDKLVGEFNEFYNTGEPTTDPEAPF